MIIRVVLVAFWVLLVLYFVASADGPDGGAR